MYLETLKTYWFPVKMFDPASLVLKKFSCAIFKTIEVIMLPILLRVPFVCFSFDIISRIFLRLLLLESVVADVAVLRRRSIFVKTASVLF